MKKKILAFLGSIFIGLGTLTSCGGFVMNDESLVISNITSEALLDGRTLITITYTDEEVEPLKIYLDKGAKGDVGETGNGIKEISYDYDKNGDYIVTVSFTDKEVEDVSFNLKNGVSITGITSTTNEETGVTTMVVNYSNGTSSKPIEIPKGVKGDDGSKLINYGAVPNEDGSQTLFFAFSTGEMVSVDIEAPKKGEDGNGISYIVGSETDDKYCVEFFFTDPNKESSKVYFNKPQAPSSWHEGQGTPSSGLGEDGDFYFDSLNDDIYFKVDGLWGEPIVDFPDTETTCRVVFDLNGEGAYLDDTYEYSLKHTITKGTNFSCNDALVPVAKRDGYTFGGWYTTKSPNLLVNGSFNDLTTVSSDMTLYARWVENTSSNE